MIKLSSIILCLFLISGCDNEQKAQSKVVVKPKRVKKTIYTGPVKVDDKTKFQQAARKFNRHLSREGVQVSLELSKHNDLIKQFGNLVSQESGPCGERILDAKVSFLSELKIILAIDKLAMIEGKKDILDVATIYNEKRKAVSKVFIPYGFEAEGISHDRKSILKKIRLSEKEKKYFPGIDNALIKSGHVYIKFQNGPIEVADWEDQKEHILQVEEASPIKDFFQDSSYIGVMEDKSRNSYVAYNLPCT